MKRELDTADRKIVELLQEDARLPLKSIADKVSLTSPTVSARIDRLEKGRGDHRLPCECEPGGFRLSDQGIHQSGG